jgi:hypothetical protein
MAEKPTLYYWDRRSLQPDGTVTVTQRWVSKTKDGPREEIGPVAAAHIFEMARYANERESA